MDMGSRPNIYKRIVLQICTKCKHTIHSMLFMLTWYKSSVYLFWHNVFIAGITVVNLLRLQPCMSGDESDSDNNIPSFNDVMKWPPNKQGLFERHLPKSSKSTPWWRESCAHDIAERFFIVYPSLNEYVEYIVLQPFELESNKIELAKLEISTVTRYTVSIYTICIVPDSSLIYPINDITSII